MPEIAVQENGPGAFGRDERTPEERWEAIAKKHGLPWNHWPTLTSSDPQLADKKIDQAKKKADLGLIPLKALYGPSRVFSYGAKKYAEGNFYEAMLSDGAGRRYISALLRHCSEMQDPNGLHTPSSLAERDVESGLPHIDHAICGLLMLRQILTKDGTLPVDPETT